MNEYNDNRFISNQTSRHNCIYTNKTSLEQIFQLVLLDEVRGQRSEVNQSRSADKNKKSPVLTERDLASDLFLKEQGIFSWGVHPVY